MSDRRISIEVKYFYNEVKNYINKNAWDEVYAMSEVWASQGKLSPEHVGEFTSLMLDSGCKPLEHMTSVPIYYLNNTDYTGIIVPNNIIHIDMRAFSYMFELEYLTLGENVEYIDSFAFLCCTSLHTLEAYPSLKTIDGRPFAKCPSLKEIKFNGTKEQWSNIKISRDAIITSSLQRINCTDGVLKVER